MHLFHSLDIGRGLVHLDLVLALVQQFHLRWKYSKGKCVYTYSFAIPCKHSAALGLLYLFPELRGWVQ